MNSSSFSHYLNEIGTFPKLTRKREYELGKAVQIGFRSAACKADREASETAQQELIRSNLRLVVSIACRYSSCTLSLEELTSDGNQGLTKAAARYHPGKFGARFSTYATYWIRDSMHTAIHNSRTIRTPVRRMLELKRIRECPSFTDDGQDQDIDKIHKETGISKRQIVRIFNNPRTVISLDAAMSEDSEEAIGTVLGSDQQDPLDVMMRAEELGLFHAALAVLDSPCHDIHVVCHNCCHSGLLS